MRPGHPPALNNGGARYLIAAARGILGLAEKFTLTSPDEFPRDGRVVHEHWDRLRRWMAKEYGVYGIMVKEWQERGAPHLHGLVSLGLNASGLSLG